MKSIISCLLMMAGIATTAMAQNIQNNANSNHGNKFEHTVLFAAIGMTVSFYYLCKLWPGKKPIIIDETK